MVNAVVLDASYALAIVMHDEKPPASIDEAIAARLIVPSIWMLEMVNAAISSIKRRRMDEAQAERMFAAMERLGVETYPPASASPQHWFGFARTHGLSAYDAQYLDLALQQRCAVATQDTDVAKAASRLGLRVLS